MKKLRFRISKNLRLKINLKVNKKHLAIAGLLVLFVFMMMDLNSRLSELSRLTAQRNVIRTEVYQLTQTEMGLQKQIAFATSEVAVEEWAREQGHMALPGDQVVVPLPPGEVTPVPIVPTVVMPTPAENWEIWRVLFFGK